MGYEAPILRSGIPEYMKVTDPDYCEALRDGVGIQFKTTEDEKNFYIALGWNACVSQMKENENVLKSI